MKTNKYDAYEVRGMLISVDFNGALFVSEIQKMNKEDLHKIYFITASFVALFHVLYGTLQFLTDKRTKKAK